MFILHPNQFLRDQVMVYGITIWFARRWDCNAPVEIHQFYDCHVGQRSRDTHVCIEMVGPIICHIIQDNEPWCRLYMDTRAWEAVGNPTRQEFVTNFVWFCWYWWYYNCTILKIQWTISNRFRHGLRNVWPTAEYGCRSSYNGLRTLRLGLWALRP